MLGARRAALGLVVMLGPVALAELPTCVIEAMDNFQNGPCNLGDTSCYCTPANKKVLGSDIVMACVNDSTDQVSK